MSPKQAFLPASARELYLVRTLRNPSVRFCLVVRSLIYMIVISDFGQLWAETLE
jgi:hypothetical protein